MKPIVKRAAALIIIFVEASTIFYTSPAVAGSPLTWNKQSGFFAVFTAGKLGLTGYDIRSLHAAVCTSSGLVEVPLYVLPRRVEKVYLINTESVVYTPSYGDHHLKPSDIIVVQLPRSILKSPSGRMCDWGRHYALERLHNRLVIYMSKDTEVLAAGPYGLRRTRLNEPVTLLIYYDVTPGFPPRVLPISKALELIKLATGKADWRLLEEARRFYAKEASSCCSILREEMQHRNGWLLSKDYSRLLEREIAERSPDSVYIDGGGGGLDVYWFAVQLIPRERPVTLRPGGEKRIKLYLGDNLLDVGLHVEAYNPGSTTACLYMTLSLESRDGFTIATARRISIAPGEDTIVSVYPSSVSLDRYYTVSIVLRNCGTAPVTIKLASLDWTKNPTTGSQRFEREGVEILSYGLKALDPSLSRLRYVQPSDTPGYSGIAFRPASYQPPLKSVGFLYTYPNGAHISMLGQQGMLIVDVAVYALTHVRGHIYVEVNGFQYKAFSVDTGPGITAYRLAIPLWRVLDYFEYAAGGVVVVSTDLTQPAVEKVAVDSALVYKYMPEVWDPENTITWALNPSPALKALFYQDVGLGMLFETSLVAERTMFYNNNKAPLVVAVEASKKKGSQWPVSDIELNVTVPAGMSFESMEAQVKTDKDYWYSQLDKYVGLAKTLHGILTTAETVLEFVTKIPSEVSATLFVSGIVIDIVAEAKGSLKVEQVPSQGVATYRVHWVGGVGGAGFAQLRLIAPLSKDTRPGTYDIKVSVSVNGFWKAKELPLRVEVIDYQGLHGSVEPPGPYSERGILQG